MIKADYIGQITIVLRTEEAPITPLEICKTLNWDKKIIDEFCAEFGAKTFNEALQKIEGVKVKEDGNKTLVYYNKHWSITATENTNTPPHTSSATHSPDTKQNKPTATNANINNSKQINSAKEHEKIKKLLPYLNSGLYEKEEAIRLALLCAVAGESIFFLGPPGTAKSMISRRIKEAFKGSSDTGKAEYFEYLMNEFSTPDEIFGTIKLKGLDEGIYEKNTEGYLPQANIAFLDEIWKSGPAILNTLLTIINEKKFHNGKEVNDVPLQILLAASNELPKEKAGLEALYDRFIVRTIVNPVTNEKSFFSLCEKSGEEIEIPEDLKLDVNDFYVYTKKDASGKKVISNWQSQIEKVALDKTVKEIITEIRKELVLKNQPLDAKIEELKTKDGSEKEIAKIEKEKYYVSDRRWKKIVHLLKTSAFLCGRDAVDLMDCQLITYCIWNTAKQREEVQTIVKDIVSQYGLDCNTAIKDIEAAIKQFEKHIDKTFFNRKSAATNSNTSNGGLAIYRMQDGNNAYKLLNQSGICIPLKYSNSWFYSPANICPYYFSAVHNTFYDKNCNNILDLDIDFGSILISGDILKFRSSTGSYYSFDLEPANQKASSAQAARRKNSEIFNNENILRPVQEDADRQYKKILDFIEKEKKSFNKVYEQTEKLYDGNLFADKSFKKIISGKLNEAKKSLEDANVQLDKQRSRYIDTPYTNPNLRQLKRELGTGVKKIVESITKGK